MLPYAARTGALPGIERIVLRAAMVLALVVACLLFGVVSAFGSVTFGALMAGAMIGLFLLAMPVQNLLLGVIVLAFFIVGQLFYFAGIGQAVWVVFGMGALLYVKWIALASRRHGPLRLDALSSAVVAFLLAFVLAVLVNQPPALQALAGGKNLVLMWSVFLLVAGGFVRWEGLRRIWLLLEWALYFQVPIVVYQYFVVAPSRTSFGATAGGVEWDAVVGGFGGDPLGGGYSGGMAWFVSVMAVYGIALYRRRQIGALRLTAMLLSALLCVVLAEVKVVVVLIPAAAALVLLKDIRKHPVLVAIGIPAALALALGMLMAYQSLHYAGTASHSTSIDQMVTKAFGYSLDPDQINYRTGEMGRVAAVSLWFRDALVKDPFHGVFGYGPGASRGRSIAGAGEVARRYPFLVDRSAATQLLWDVGFAGFSAYLVAMGLGAIRAVRQSRDERGGPWKAAMLEACGAGLGMLVVMTFYGRDQLEAPAICLFSILLLGIVALAGRERGADATRGVNGGHAAAALVERG
ncbi:MAG: hypothetical protein CMK33_01145 [Porticoccaceae bacterium]|nr:hypothetical protein [Porticoccaceae bacterium]